MPTGFTELETTTPAPKLDDGDHDRFAHYVRKDKLAGAYIEGTPVTALCGKVWVPSRDPERFPLCQECKRLYDLGPDGRRREWDERARSQG
ncbi:MAG: DUF3039 domain-containing protein [Actinomycetota bacterium]|nr:DUF3039 domain-containing protein [Actinomycetota bacterium]